MIVPLWVSELAAAFWAAAGGPEAFPRTLRAAIVRSTFDLSVKEVPGLTVAAVEGYLARLGRDWSSGGPDRRLRACLVARNEAGFIFLDAADAADERVFSLAHEVAHFLNDYWQPRRRAALALGEAVLEVLDGRRPPRPGERLQAVLHGLPVGCHTHLMERDGDRLPAGVASAERDADRLAYELLAPAAEVRARLSARARAGGIVPLLRESFGLPLTAAAGYAKVLCPPAGLPDPLISRLKKAWELRRTSTGRAGMDSGGTPDEQRP